MKNFNVKDFIWYYIDDDKEEMGANIEWLSKRLFKGSPFNDETTREWERHRGECLIALDEVLNEP